MPAHNQKKKTAERRNNDKTMKLKTKNPFGAATPASKKKSTYPVVDNAEAVEAATEIAEMTPKHKDLGARIAENKTILGELIAEAWFDQNEGKSETESSFEIPAGRNKVLVTMTSRYREVEADDVAEIIEELDLGDHFEEKMVLKLDSRKIPEGALSPFLDELKEICDKHGATEAVSVKQVVVPTAGFHEERHKLMSKEVNEIVHQAIPAVASVRVR